MTTILIVDDDPGIRDLLVRVLNKNSFDTITAKDGRSALRQIQDPSITLVITDIFMPELDGLEFISKIRATRPWVKVIAMSGGTDYFDADNYLSMAKHLGAVTFLTKPIYTKDLLQAISDLMKAKAVE